MKLLTEMHDSFVRVHGFFIDDSAASSTASRILLHDAAAAHALMQAVEEFTNNNVFQTYYASTWINQRAYSIMAEWGFDTPPEAKG